MKRILLVKMILVFAFYVNSDAQNVFPSNGKVGIATLTPKEQLQIGDRWTFHNGGTKVIGYNTFYDGSTNQDKRLFSGGASQIRFGSAGEITFFNSAIGTANSIFNPNVSLLISNSGSVGVGTTSPISKLHIDHSGSALTFSRSGFATYSFLHGVNGLGLYDNSLDGMPIFFRAGTNRIGFGTDDPKSHLHIRRDDPTIILEDNFGMTGSPDISTFTIASANGWGRLISEKSVVIFLDSDNNDPDDSVNNVFRIASNSSSFSGSDKTNFQVFGNGNANIMGNLGIGTLDTKGYELAVAGRVIAEEIRVKLRGTWPDYIFESNYQLMPIKELESYIIQNKHLPGIPSEAKIKENDIDLGEINLLLLTKIEELTLYIIEQQKQIDELREVTKAINDSKENKK